MSDNKKTATQVMAEREDKIRSEQFWEWFNSLPYELQDMVQRGMAYQDAVWAARYEEIVKSTMPIAAARPHIFASEPQ